MTKRYSFQTEQQAIELILLLAHEDNELTFDKITGTKTTAGIVCLGFQDKYGWDLAEDDENYLENREWVLIQEGLTYDVDVFWRNLPNEDWVEFEVEPKTPNHFFA